MFECVFKMNLKEALLIVKCNIICILFVWITGITIACGLITDTGCIHHKIIVNDRWLV